MKAIRDAYGEALEELGSLNNKVVVLEADVGNSTKSILFGKRFPNRYFNVGIAELNMTGMAAGFASSGFMPFVNSFAYFMTTRGSDPIISMAAYDNLNVKFVGSYCGLSDSYDGASHHAISDIALLRALPNITILSPCDPIETKKAVFAAAVHKGPVYLRLSRDNAPTIFGEDYNYKIGKGEIVRDGTDLTIISTGIHVHISIKTAELLKEKGISTRVVNMHTVLPIDKDLIVRCANETGSIVTVEEHSVRGGLGSAVSEILSQYLPTRLKIIGIQSFAESGSYSALLKKYALDSESIFNACIEFLH